MADAGERKLTGTFHILIIEEFTFVWFPRMAASIEGGRCWFGIVQRRADRPWHASEARKGYNQIGIEVITRLYSMTSSIAKVLLNGSIFWVSSAAIQ
jgi:hypothetical protein